MTSWPKAPTRLVGEWHGKEDGTAPDVPLTVYTIRLTTGYARGGAMSDPHAAVNVCLLGQSGTAALTRISPVNDPGENREHTMEICQLIGPEVGADCDSALALAQAASTPAPPHPPSQSAAPAPPSSPSPASSSASASARGGPAAASSSSSGSQASYPGTTFTGRPPPPPPPKRRFQEGMVDEVSVLLPELGPLVGVLVGCESGSWYLEEVDVASSRTSHTDRFVCRRMLGGRPGEGAAHLTPVPAGAVVYGEGEAAVMLTKEQATALWSLHMSDYEGLKRRTAATTAALVGAGAALLAALAGPDAALPFAAGGAVGLVYQWLLMQGVDHVVSAAAGQQRQEQAAQQQQALPAPGGQTLGRLLASPPVRLGFVCASAALGLALLPGGEEAGAPGGTSMGGAVLSAAAGGAVGAGGGVAVWQLALGALGFLTYKVALVGSSLSQQGAGAGPADGQPGQVAQRASSKPRVGGAEGEKYKRD